VQPLLRPPLAQQQATALPGLGLNLHVQCNRLFAKARVHTVTKCPNNSAHSPSAASVVAASATAVVVAIACTAAHSTIMTLAQSPTWGREPHQGIQGHLIYDSLLYMLLGLNSDAQLCKQLLISCRMCPVSHGILPATSLVDNAKQNAQ
jgi:hypothetical protein